LTLKTVCGFGVKEIARAFLTKEETVANGLFERSKRFATKKSALRNPIACGAPGRLDAVWILCICSSNEGYAATEGETLVRKDICSERFEFWTVLVGHPSR